MTSIFNKNRILYFYTFLLIASSTIPFFRNSLVFYICLFFSILHFNSFKNYKNAFSLIIFVVILEIYHLVYFSSDYDSSVVRVVIFSFVIGLGFAIQCRTSFLITFIKIIHFFSIVSLVIFTILLISEPTVKSIDSFFAPIFTIENVQYGDILKQVNPIFYNFDYNFYSIRNNGPFWEPTIFATLLILSIIFNIILFKNIKNKYLIVSVITLITTLSTTGFIAFSILMITLLLLSGKFKLPFKFFLTALCVGVFFIFYINTTFLEEKITTEYASRQDAIYDKGGDSRIASAILDLNEVTEKPEYFIFGKGSDKRTRIGTRDKEVLRNNGFTALLVQRGVLFLFLYIFGIYYTFYMLCKINGKDTKMAIAFVLAILILSCSEILFDLVIFHMLAFLGIVLKYHSIKSQKLKNNA